MNILEASGITVTRGNRQILKGVDITVGEGELCCLLGPNGCGKTTLIHAIAGLIKCEGTVMLDGMDILKMNERQRAKCLSFIPQVLSRQPGRKVIDAVLMGCNPYISVLSGPDSAQKAHAMSVLNDAGLGDKADCDFESLSQGEKQLAVLARCTMQNAKFMLMDEPDSSLDFSNRNMILTEIRSIIRDKNYSGIISMHDPGYALRFCDRIYLMDSGNIVCEIDAGSVDAVHAENILRKVYPDIRIVDTQFGPVAVNAGGMDV